MKRILFFVTTFFLSVAAYAQENTSLENSRYIAEFNSRCNTMFDSFRTDKKNRERKMLCYIGVFKMTDDSMISDGTLRIDLLRGYVDPTEQKAPYEDFSFKNSLSIIPLTPDANLKAAWRLVLENVSNEPVFVHIPSCALVCNDIAYRFPALSEGNQGFQDEGATASNNAAENAKDKEDKIAVEPGAILLEPGASVTTYAITIEEGFGEMSMLSGDYFGEFARDGLGSVHNFSQDNTPCRITIEAVWSKNGDAGQTQKAVSCMYMQEAICHFDPFLVNAKLEEKAFQDIPANYPVKIFMKPMMGM